MFQGQPTSVGGHLAVLHDGHGCSIRAYPDGPYVVRGAFEFIDAHGQRVPLRRRTIALCRCGHTRTAPFCDGTHKIISFRTDPAADAVGARGPADGAQLIR
jgi:CDGSH-type Zn-finger protein